MLVGQWACIRDALQKLVGALSWLLHEAGTDSVPLVQTPTWIREAKSLLSCHWYTLGPRALLVTTPWPVSSRKCKHTLPIRARLLGFDSICYNYILSHSNSLDTDNIEYLATHKTVFFPPYCCLVAQSCPTLCYPMDCQMMKPFINMWLRINHETSH